MSFIFWPISTSKLQAKPITGRRQPRREQYPAEIPDTAQISCTILVVLHKLEPTRDAKERTTIGSHQFLTLIGEEHAGIRSARVANHMGFSGRVQRSRAQPRTDVGQRLLGPKTMVQKIVRTAVFLARRFVGIGAIARAILRGTVYRTPNEFAVDIAATIFLPVPDHYRGIRCQRGQIRIQGELETCTTLRPLLNARGANATSVRFVAGCGRLLNSIVHANVVCVAATPPLCIAVALRMIPD